MFENGDKFVSVYFAVLLSGFIIVSTGTFTSRNVASFSLFRQCCICMKNEPFSQTIIWTLTFYLIEMPFNAFANKTDPEQADLVRAA